MEKEKILSAFIAEIKKEFKDENWDYLDFIKERVLSSQPETSAKAPVMKMPPIIINKYMLMASFGSIDTKENEVIFSIFRGKELLISDVLDFNLVITKFIEFAYAPVNMLQVPTTEEIETKAREFAQKCDPRNETRVKQADIYFGFKMCGEWLRELSSQPTTEKLSKDEINKAIDFGFNKCKEFGDITKPERETFICSLAIPEGENKQDNTSEMADEPNFFKWREDNGWFSINDKKFDYQRGFKSRQYETKEGLHKLFLNRNTL